MAITNDLTIEHCPGCGHTRHPTGCCGCGAEVGGLCPCDTLIADTIPRSLVEHEPAPIRTSGQPIWNLVIADMKDRDRVGRERYGTPLQANNGRDALVDVYQELLDAVVYLRQVIEERG